MFLMLCKYTKDMFKNLLINVLHLVSYGILLSSSQCQTGWGSGYSLADISLEGSNFSLRSSSRVTVLALYSHHHLKINVHSSASGIARDKWL